ncbi:YigZ family protein [Mesomycoplasma moatsii]|uniref:YigZ family protein n=1 Tax=Mesomycoplasma moatsii TaxID=171287 RepID=UPI0003B50E04
MKDKIKSIYQYEIQKSKFIGVLCEINDLYEIEEILFFLKKEYKNAKHICYAYKIQCKNGIKIKAFDDKEPKGTASTPLLNAIKIYKKSNVVLFIIRYFGGKKLGIGGLYRSYSKTALETIKQFLDHEIV